MELKFSSLLDLLITLKIYIFIVSTSLFPQLEFQKPRFMVENIFTLAFCQGPRVFNGFGPLNFAHSPFTRD